jgi:putative two-component system response regulator
MKQKNILVVDDAPETIDILVGLLRGKYKVKAALNGETALKIATTMPPDLILLDIVMPGIDGVEVCRRLKEDGSTANIPIVFLSGKASGEDCEEGLELGASAYLKKPIDAGSLFSLLDILLPVSSF